MRALEIANVVDSVSSVESYGRHTMRSNACDCSVQLYRTLSVRVVVVHVITWSSGDRIMYPPDGDSSVLLNNLRDFEPQITPVHDSTMLIT